MSKQNPFFGEVINGRMWTGDEWVAVDGLKPGDVVGEMMWTGTHWVPTTPPPPRPKETPLRKKWWFILIVALTVLTAVGMIVDPAEPAAPKTSQAQPQEPEEEDRVVPGLDDPVVDGDLQFTATDVDAGVDEIPGSFYDYSPEGSFTLVEMEIKNVGDNPAGFTWANVNGTITGDAPIDSNAVGSYYANPTGQAGPFISDVNPGAEIKATIVFDVPDGLVLETVVGHDHYLSDGAVIHLP